MKYYCVFLLLILMKPCASQILRSSLPASYNRVGIYSTHFTDALSFTGNQASLAAIKNISAGVYSEKRYLLQDLEQLSMAISFPCLQGGAGIGASYTGFTEYNEAHIGLAYGRALSAKIYLGIQFNYDRVSVAGYGGAGAVSAEIGTIIHATDKIILGLHIYNPAGGKFSGNSGEKLASEYTFGFGYEVSEKLLLASEIIKGENQAVNINVHLHYAFVQQFFIRGGISSGTGSYFAGVGTAWRKTRLDITASWHQQLGLTPALLLAFQLGKNKTEHE